ncbi:epoxide hydrolase [Amycolatopsis antarctica]|uniref:Epoxide hydrolase n=1 Tax=Amycolatopsis antarctica TaxID=1854586 RepID=A0A263DBF1_9PSEU|nr:epoxide hydrolase family protein [Amycolatopsis antarctica]OZM74837.1 epoxide hydrolase [Amycolatopsis antarctica]
MTSSDEIHPFRIDVPQAELDELGRRIENTRWPQELPGAGWAYGVPVGYLKGLADYWRTGYDWRAHERRLNEFAQYTTEIDGQNVHFLHVRSPEPGALPMVLTHGWPGSVVEFAELVGPLTDPAAHGGDPADAFHVVVPSLPGFGFSGPTTEPGWTSRRIAVAWAELMRRLGYDRYVAQGGDFGAGISRDLGLVDGEHVAAIHVNGGFGYPDVPEEELADLTVTEKARIARMNEFMREQGGYLAQQSSRPQTLAYGLADSPAGQLAWIVERFREWTDPDRELPEDAVDRDWMLTNVTIYWLTGTVASSARLYYEDTDSGAGWAEPEPSTVPSAVAQFGIQDVAIRRCDEKSNNIARWTEFDRGGHFAALEAPDLLLGDVRDFFRDYR